MRANAHVFFVCFAEHNPGSIPVAFAVPHPPFQASVDPLAFLANYYSCHHNHPPLSKTC
eukprot:Gb_31037 [translate_table: standard]